MNIEEAKQAAKSGHLITHGNFMIGEFVTVNLKGEFVDEEGIELEWDEFWKLRENFSDTWEILLSA